MQSICHKEVYQALQDLPVDQLHEVPPAESVLSHFSSFARISLQNAYSHFEKISKKTEKKWIIEAHIYLDALIKLHRTSKQIHMSIHALSQKLFRSMPPSAIQLLLEKFTSVQQENPGEAARFMRHKGAQSLLEDDGKDEGAVKFVKTKEKQKQLMLNLIGVAIILSPNSRLRASTLSHMLKKDTGDLKHYLKELGVRVETTVGTAKEAADLMLYFDGRESKRAAKEKKEEDNDGEEAQEDGDKEVVGVG